MTFSKPETRLFSVVESGKIGVLDIDFILIGGIMLTLGDLVGAILGGDCVGVTLVTVCVGDSQFGITQKLSSMAKMSEFRELINF